MALTQEDNIQLQKQQNGVLNINAVKYYFDHLRPALQKFNKTYHTDRELNRTIVEVMNRADSAATEKRYHDLEESYANLVEGIQDKSYMTAGPMRYGSEEEKKAVVELIEKFSDLSVILKYEHEPVEEKHEIKERLNYQPPNGGIEGYNLDDLSNRGPKPNRERIPNQSVIKDKYAY